MSDERIEDDVSEFFKSRSDIVLVHGHAAVDLNIVRDVLSHHLDDLAEFADVIRTRLHKPA